MANAIRVFYFAEYQHSKEIFLQEEMGLIKKSELNSRFLIIHALSFRKNSTFAPALKVFGNNLKIKTTTL